MTVKRDGQTDGARGGGGATGGLPPSRPGQGGRSRLVQTGLVGRPVCGGSPTAVSDISHFFVCLFNVEFFFLLLVQFIIYLPTQCFKRTRVYFKLSFTFGFWTQKQKYYYSSSDQYGCSCL